MELPLFSFPHSSTVCFLVATSSALIRTLLLLQISRNNDLAEDGDDRVKEKEKSGRGILALR